MKPGSRSVGRVVVEVRPPGLGVTVPGATPPRLAVVARGWVLDVALELGAESEDAVVPATLAGPSAPLDVEAAVTSMSSVDGVDEMRSSSLLVAPRRNAVTAYRHDPVPGSSTRRGTSDDSTVPTTWDVVAPSPLRLTS